MPIAGNKEPFILYGQYYGCWWPGDGRSHDISSHDIDSIFLEYSGLGIRKVNPKRHKMQISFRKYAFMFMIISATNFILSHSGNWKLPMPSSKILAPTIHSTGEKFGWCKCFLIVTISLWHYNAYFIRWGINNYFTIQAKSKLWTNESYRGLSKY